MVEEFVFLFDLGLIALVALGISLLFARLRMSIAIGQLIAGMALGPFGLALIQDVETINLVSSLGIILLLFVIGLEMDPQQLRRVGVVATIFATFEVALAFVLGLGTGLFLGWELAPSLFLAAALSISSTAVIGKGLLGRRSIHGANPHLLMGILIVEDIIAVILLVILPSIAIAGTVSVNEFILFLAKGGLLISSVTFVGIVIAPRIIEYVSQYEVEHGEITLLLALGLGFFFAVVAAALGFSPAIGAFLFGLTIRGKWSRFLSRKVGPLKDVFVVFFFVTMGTLVDPSSLTTSTFPILMLLGVSLMSKFAGGWIGSSALKSPRSKAIMGILLIPRAEFSLLFAKLGSDLQLLPPEGYSVIGLVCLGTLIVGSLIQRNLVPGEPLMKKA